MSRMDGKKKHTHTQYLNRTYSNVCVCVCVRVVIPFILDVRLVDTPAWGHKGFIHLPYPVLALILIARRMQPSLSLVNREVEFLCSHARIELNRSPLVWHDFNSHVRSASFSTYATVQYRPTHKKYLLPPRMQAQFLNSPLFLIASQEYCPYFLFPLFLVSSPVISSYFCVVVAILKTNFRCQYYRTTSV